MPSAIGRLSALVTMLSRFNFVRAGTHMAMREVARVEYGNRDLHGLEQPKPAPG